MALIRDLLGGQIHIRHIGPEIDQHHAGHFFFRLRTEITGREGKIAEITMGSEFQLPQRRFSGAETLVIAGFLHLQRLWCRRQEAVFFFQKQLQDLLPGQAPAGRKIFRKSHSNISFCLS